MPIPDWKLLEWAQNGGVEPFDLECLNPASLDLRVGNEFVKVKNGERITGKEILIPPGVAILATTIEYIKMPIWAAGVLYLKSTMARLGLDHSLAGFVDPGFEGQLTMELHSHREIILEAGQRIVQIALNPMHGEPLQEYDGRYQGQRGPTEARDEL